ncbi:MAG TPA: TraR/DksA C4-type zinc finger protein, partial [Opitutales bacterium]|nr:TraR/DksA C4-type zinc finger protein [Opitutales bacterium]
AVMKKPASADKAAAKTATTLPPPPPFVEPDPKAKAIMLNARKRKSTPAIFKIRSRKNTPIVFTLDEVRDLIKNRKNEKEKTGKTSDTKAAFLAAKQIAERNAASKGRTPSPLKPAKSRVLGAASLADILGVATPPKTQKAVSIAQMMDNENIAPKYRRFYRQLVEMREQIRQGLDLHTSETLKRSSKEDSGDLSGYSQHMADAGTDTFDRDFALSLVSSEQELLYEIEEALKRIRKGSYGTCEITGQQISNDRLAAVPFTRYSLDGQKELEKQRRYGVQRSNAVGLFGEATTEDAAALAEDDADAT